MRRNSAKGIVEVEPFYCWGIEFIGLFPPSHSHVYIMVCMDYDTKCVKAIACAVIDAQIVVMFFRNNIFFRFRIPEVLIIDRRHTFAKNIWKIC